MASAYFKEFAIENGLTIDYGYMFGYYKGFFISIKETLGSTKYLNINCQLGTEKETLKRVLSVFTDEENNDLQKYCISNYKFESEYLQFTFELQGDKSKLIIEFLNRFITSFQKNILVNKVICPVCQKEMSTEEIKNATIVDNKGILFPSHKDCYETKVQEIKEKSKKEVSEENKDDKYSKGLLGSILFSLIYMAILIVVFVFTQLVIMNAEEDDSFVRILQYFPVLMALLACPLIYKGYDIFKGKKGTTKYIIILWTVIISTFIGTFFGFVTSLLTVVKDQTVLDLAKLVIQLITGSYQRFRWGFYLYIIISEGFAILSMVFKFSGKEEMEKASENTFEKLE